MENDNYLAARYNHIQFGEYCHACYRFFVAIKCVDWSRSHAVVCVRLTVTDRIVSG